jgi:carbamoyl-phosphate synthase large subunit
MGVSASRRFGNAFAKAWLGAGEKLPLEGAVFVSVHDRDKAALVPVAERLSGQGFRLLATEGTAAYLATQGLQLERVLKLHEGRPHIGDLLINGEMALVINTPLGRTSHEDDDAIRRLALKHGVPCVTTISGAMAAAEGIASLREDGLSVTPLQELYGR